MSQEVEFWLSMIKTDCIGFSTWKDNLGVQEDSCLTRAFLRCIGYRSDCFANAHWRSPYVPAINSIRDSEVVSAGHWGKRENWELPSHISDSLQASSECGMS
jgi:hypothetical protein